MCTTRWLKKLRKQARILGGLPPDFLLAVMVAILLGIKPMTWGFKLFLLLILIAIAAELAWRIPLPSLKMKALAASLAAVAAGSVGYGPVEDQYHIDAVLRDYHSTRDLVAKFEIHDESLKNVVAQYDRLKQANSLFERWFGKPYNDQEVAITAQSIEDLKVLLNNFSDVATPMGDALGIKLGPNMYRIIFPVPMRITPQLEVNLPPGVTKQIIESSNIGFTVLYLPLSQPLNIFGRPINRN